MVAKVKAKVKAKVAASMWLPGDYFAVMTGGEAVQAYARIIDR